MNDKHLWEIKHPYYCTEGGYTHSQEQHKTIWEFKSWADFFAEMGDADMDYNMLFRWDWDEMDDDNRPTFTGDPYYRNGKLKMFFMVQRKGFHSCSIIDVCRADEPAVIEYLMPRLAHLMSLWEPLARITTEDGK
ncbi:hypothetical protein DM48_315 [Burkholderia gladioli]|uniref:Uncharacterized protein n=1 Tax=Burkholderia gladioli TaxID=28095 RepID=A0AAW3EVQ3_BURGA|nr:hypothetical protein [Burkholderia gladioli]KGC12964.1 hypothetical protein DM48_315 [Burkholderia gladioli]